LAEQAEEATRARIMVMDAALKSLSAHNLTFFDLMQYVFDPEQKQGSTRWGGFFRRPGSATHILGLWVSLQNAPTARQEVDEWAVARVSHLVKKEAGNITHSKVLQRTGRNIDEKYVLGFSMGKLRSTLEKSASIMLRIANSFATSARDRKNAVSRKTMVCTYL
jgi:hypothetical protein